MKVAELMKAKAHLNKDGLALPRAERAGPAPLEEIRLIKSGMNSNRY